MLRGLQLLYDISRKEAEIINSEPLPWDEAAFKLTQLLMMRVSSDSDDPSE